MKDIPKFYETFIPILDILNQGEELHYKELARRVKVKYYSDLREELLSQKVSSGKNRLEDRIGWGASYLKLAGYLESPERGRIKITQKGLKQLDIGSLSLSDLKSQKAYMQHQEKVRNKKNDPNDELDYKASPQDLMDAGYEQMKDQTMANTLDRLKNVDPYYFETIILKLLNKMGYGDLIETSKSNDGGIDGIINEDELGLGKIYIQAKRYGENRVREKDIRNFIGAMSGDTDKGVFVTTSEFDSKAKLKAKDARHTIILIDGSKMAELMYKHGVGVQVRTTYDIKTLDEDFFEG